MAWLKKVVKKTPLYSWLKYWRARKELAQWTPHDQEMLEFYRHFLSPGDVCFDVGANIGNRVKVFRRLGARVIAVEPQRECVRVLKAAFGGDPQLTIAEMVLGPTEGRAEMMISDANTFSSLSEEWVDAVVRSGRFADQRWNRKQAVSMTTLDRLIERYGVPAFVKIDVEGFESEVVKGLSRPVKALSIEFVPEFIGSTLECLEHLDRLGGIRLNHSLAESMKLELDDWVDRGRMVEILTALPIDRGIWGDVYVRFAAE